MYMIVYEDIICYAITYNNTLVICSSVANRGAGVKKLVTPLVTRGNVFQINE